MDLLKLFYDLANAQGIKTSPTGQTMPSSHTITNLTPTISPISATKTTFVAPGVDQIVDVATILIVEDIPLSPISTKRGQDEGQPSLPEEGSPKRSRLTRDASPY